VYGDAREADAERLAVALAESRPAAQEARAGVDRYRQRAAADAAEAVRRGAEVNELIALAANPATDRGEAVAAARKAALALADSGGPWTREAAEDALAGSDDVVLEFARHGVAAAAAQDDRVTVASLASTGSPAMGRAAEAALAAGDAAVAQFLRTQDYPERRLEDRIAVTLVLTRAQTDGDPVLAQRARDVLADGTVPVMRRFLTVDQFDVAAIGDRVRASVLLADEASGPEVRAAAQVALDGPPAALRDFLDAGQHSARQRDLDAAAHEAQVSALLSQATAAATTAVQQAQEAQAVAATARGNAAEAAQWASRAQDSARAAAGFAVQATASAERAEQSADRATASARTAAEAAATASAAANRAGHSAAWAQDSYRRANTAARGAYESAAAARDSAIAAGESATEALAHFGEAIDAAGAAAERERREENARQALMCQAEYLPDTQPFKDCIHHIELSDVGKLGTAMYNAEMCAKMSAPDSAYHRYCLYDSFNPNFGLNRSLDLTQTFVEEMIGFEGLVLDLLTLALPGKLGLVVDGLLLLMGGPEALFGEGGLFDASDPANLLNLAAILLGRTRRNLHGPSGLRLPAFVQRVAASNETAKALLARLAAGLDRCLLPGNSFVGDTPVLLADGTSRPIRAVRVGDRVLAADPVTGVTGPRPVTATVTGTGHKRLVAVTVDTDGAAGGATATVTATDNHPFWVVDLARWVDAGKLAPGQWLRTSAGTYVQVTAVAARTGQATVHNLAVADLHTYHVLTGRVPVLVHNDDPCDIALGVSDYGELAKWAEANGYKHFMGSKYDDYGWLLPVEKFINSGERNVHVRLKWFDGVGARNRFLDAAFLAARKRLDAGATRYEMGLIARAVYLGRRSWSSIRFYDDAGVRVTFAEPDWWNLVTNTDRNAGITKWHWQRWLDEARYDRENGLD
jgi:hypothetical protein